MLPLQGVSNGPASLRADLHFCCGCQLCPCELAAVVRTQLPRLLPAPKWVNSAVSEPWAEFFLPPSRRPWPAHTDSSSHPREDHGITRKSRLEGTSGGLQTNLLLKAGSATQIKHIQPCYAFCHIAQQHVQTHSSGICECFLHNKILLGLSRLC